MLRTPKGARRYNERITLTRAQATVDDYGHVSMGATVNVMNVYASVKQMSATKTMLTFQQADVVGVEIEFRAVSAPFNGITWNGHSINFSTPDPVDNRERIVRVTGWYQVDNPDAQ